MTTGGQVKGQGDTSVFFYTDMYINRYRFDCLSTQTLLLACPTVSHCPWLVKSTTLASKMLDKAE